MSKPIYLFLLGCIPLRLFISFFVKNVDKKYLKYLSLLFSIQGFSFLYLYFFNKRLNAVEAGGKTWWADYRLIHGFLYITASIYAYQEKNIAWIPLMIDVLFGVSIFFNRLIKNL